MKPIHWFSWLFFFIAVTAAAVGAAGIPEGYDPSIRPGEENGPTQVQVGVFVIDVVQIDDILQSFTASLYFDVRYKDPRLADPSAKSWRVFNLEEIWWPDLGLVNRRNLSIIFPNKLEVDPEGNVVYQQRVYGDFSSPLDLRKFPFDTQLLPIEVISFSLGPKEVSFSNNPEQSGRLKSISLAGWTILNTEIGVEPHRSEISNLEQLTYHLKVARNVSYFRWNVLVPLTLIVLMAWCVFWIDPQFFPPQVSLSTASIFALIAFRFSLRSQLPKVGYMTYIDEFVLACTVLVFLALGQAILTGSLAKSGREALSKRIDFWSRYIYLLVFVVLTAATLRLHF